VSAETGASSRVPTEPKEGWSIQTALDYVLALIAAADKRYEQRFEASEKALDIGFESQKTAVIAAFASQKSAIDAAFSAQKDAINAALASADRAVTKAELATEKRFESVNEFRATLDTQQRTLIPRSEVAVIQDGLNEKIAQLTKAVDELRSVNANRAFEHRGVRDGWGYAVGAVGFLLAIGSLIALVIRMVQP